MASVKSTTASVKTAATLLSLVGEQPKPNAYGEFAKETIQKLKSSKEFEKSELQKLNSQFRLYLDDVKRLEEANRQLDNEVEDAKKIYVPREMDKSALDTALDNIRRKLEGESLDAVRLKVGIEENENTIQKFADKIKFFKNEIELQRQKIPELESIADDLNNQKDYIKRAQTMAEDDVRRERDRMEKADQDLADAIRRLKDNRLKNKQIEFEIQTLLDELAFRKAVFGEEITELGKQHQLLSPQDLTRFYKNELLTAVQEIRKDFNRLNADQLDEYKKQKERELDAVTKEAQYEKMQADLAREKLNESQDLELRSSHDLKSNLDSNKDEAKRLQKEQADLMKRLGDLESKYYDLKQRNANKIDDLNTEIDKLKAKNGTYSTDLDYWDRVTRSQLETEIQTYRSILNYQTKLLQDTKNSLNASQQKKQNKPLTAVINNNINEANLSPEEKKKRERIAVLKQVFDYFDNDKSGSINIREMDQVLKKLDVKLSQDGYNQLMKEFDRDGSGTIQFQEFCRIMLPVFTGKFEDDDLWYAFQKFDLDKSGYITAAELRQILAGIGQNFTESEIKAMISTVDANSDGRLSFNEFCRLMKSTTG